MKKSTKKTFNPDDFFTTVTIKDIAPKFEHLEQLDFKEVNLNDTLTKLNYEITSTEYIAFEHSSIKDYYHLEVDQIV